MSTAPLDSDTIRLRMARVAATMGALSDPVRLRILMLILEGRAPNSRSPVHPRFPDAVCPYLDIQKNMPTVAASKFSYHLKKLRDAALIEEYPLGKRVYCRANRTRLHAILDELAGVLQLA